jgi:hypothetical protein
MKTPTLGPDGTYTPNPTGRDMRLYTPLDTRLMSGDFFDKMYFRYAKD